MGFQPKDCIVVEDSYVGVQAAVNGGFRCFAYTKRNNARLLEDAGATVFFEMQELEELLYIS